MRVLLDNGCDPVKRDCDGLTPIDHLLQRRDPSFNILRDAVANRVRVRVLVSQ